MEQIQLLFDLLRMVRRRFFLIAFFGGLGIAATMFIAYILPAVFQTDARILVESQQIPDDLARSTVVAPAQERLERIQQRLMARGNLEQIIQEFGVYAERPDLSLTKKIERLRDATVILPTISGARPGRPGVLSAFTIRVTMNDPVQAARIANKFVTIVLDQNAKERTQSATETVAFFQRESERLSSVIQAVEAELSVFTKANEASLPDALRYNQDEVRRLRETDMSIDRTILEFEEERGQLQGRLERTRLGAETRPENPTLGQLRALEAQMAERRTVLSENHREIRQLNAQIRALRASLPADGQNSRDAIRQAEVQDLERQITLINDQIEILRAQKVEIAARRVEVEAAIQRTPEVDVTLNAYERRLIDLQDQLSAIVRKRAEAETGEKLEVNQQAERFEVVENALVPEYPISPNRKKIVVMGTAASLGMALGFAFLLEMLFPAIRSAAQMQRQLDLRPVVAIPYIRTRSERRWRLAKGVFLVLLIGVAVPGSLYAVDQYVMPLQKIGEKVVEKSGLSEYVRIIEQRF